MKKYTTLSVDYTALKAELHDYVQSKGHAFSGWFFTGSTVLSESAWNDCCAALPALTSTFADLGLSVYAFGYSLTFKGSNTRPNVFDVDTLVIPLTASSCTLSLYQPNELAEKTDTWYYAVTDCTKVEEIQITEPLLIGREVPYVFDVDTLNTLVPELVIFFKGTDADKFLV